MLYCAMSADLQFEFGEVQFKLRMARSRGTDQTLSVQV